MTPDVALGKLATIERCLQRIRTVTGGDADRVDDIDVEEIVVLNLQRAIQASIDLAAHLISGKGWGLPDSLKEGVRRSLTPSIRAARGPATPRGNAMDHPIRHGCTMASADGRATRRASAREIT